eukprot:gene14778-biopygen7885
MFGKVVNGASGSDDRAGRINGPGGKEGRNNGSGGKDGSGGIVWRLRWLWRQSWRQFWLWRHSSGGINGSGGLRFIIIDGRQHTPPSSARRVAECPRPREDLEEPCAPALAVLYLPTATCSWRWRQQWRWRHRSGGKVAAKSNGAGGINGAGGKAGGINGAGGMAAKWRH